jgi:hypothetical protein
MEEWRYNIFYLGTRWRWVVSLMPRPLYPRRQNPRYELDRRLGAPQGPSGRCGQEKKLFPLPEIEPGPSEHVVSRCTYWAISPDVYWGCTEYDCLSRYWLKVFVCFLSSSKPNAGIVHKLGHDTIRVVGCGTILQAGRSRVRFPMRSLDYFSWPNTSSRTMTLESTQPLTEMSTMILHGGKGRPAGV